MVDIRITSNIEDVRRRMDALVRKQLPFAMVQAINKTAQRVQEAETQNILKTFNNPTPFTQKSIGLTKARKSAPVATVYVKDIAASYLQPYEDGGTHKLNSRALLNPKDIKLNQYGNLPKAALARLKAKPGVFIGPVTLKNGETINGVWQRPMLRGNDAAIGKGMTVRQRQKLLRGKHGTVVPRGANTTGKLKLLIRFGDALPVKQHLGFIDVAQRTVAQNFQRDFEVAFDEAIRTAR
ncbi:MAG: hypothetical protein KUL86_06660 [Castellaniella sp.]|nr:hypothetical protein [Castellaniella sp.]